jgi:hypothetical protein
MEPRNADMEDYNGKESPQKRRTVFLVVAGLIIFGMLWDYMNVNFWNDTPEIYVPQIERGK